MPLVLPGVIVMIILAGLSEQIRIFVTDLFILVSRCRTSLISLTGLTEAINACF
jgi:hypothetical protein